MTAHDAERRFPAGIRELDPAIRAVLEQASLREAPEHPAHRRRRDVERLGDRAGLHRLATGTERVDSLEVVLDRPGKLCGSRGGSYH